MNRPCLRHIAALFALVGLLATPFLQGQELDHTPLATDASLNMRTLLELAMEHAPQALEGDARTAQARAMTAQGDSWTAGRPSLQAEYIDDRVQSDLGQRELTYGIALPLWRPGERGAMKARGAQYDEHAAAWREAFRLDIAGRLRHALAAMEEADVLLAAEQLATADARELLAIAESLFAAGETAQQNVLQARTLLLAQQRNELAAAAARVDAERNYATLTGLHARPAGRLAESLAPDEEVGAAHPLLRFLRSDIELAGAEISRAEVDARGSPTLSFGSRRQRADDFSENDNALVLSISIPVGGEAHVDAATSPARRARVDAEVQLLNTQRALNLQLHEVEHELFTLRESLPLGEEQEQLARQQWDMARVAFEAGESDMSQVVIALQQARLSARELKVLNLRHARLISEFNQIIGVLP